MELMTGTQDAVERADVPPWATTTELYLLQLRHGH
jgi:hypothetical protein